MEKYAEYFKKIRHSYDFFTPDSKDVFFTNLTSSGDQLFYHDHKFYEIVYVTEGNIKQIVNREWLNLKLGDICFLRPDDLHLYVRENNCSCSHRDLIFEKKFFEKTCDWFNKDLFNLYCLPFVPHRISLTPEHIARLDSQINKITKCAVGDYKKKTTLSKALLIDLLSILYNNLAFSAYDMQYPQLINRILERINTNYTSHIHQILSPFKYDKSYLCRQFKKHLGMTMTDYINKLRLNYVVSQLTLTRKNIIDICYEAGFYSVSYLNHLFKDKYGITPSKYRKDSKLDYY